MDYDTKASKIRVLVVEDDPDVSEALQDCLELDGYQVSLASNGRKALDYLKTTQNLPSIILLDLRMPFMNGWEFLREKELDVSINGIPVVVVSADSGNGCERPRPNAFLKKPVEMDLLLKTISDFCPSERCQQNANKLNRVYLDKLTMVIQEFNEAS